MDRDLELRRSRACFDNTVAQAIALGYRLKVKCLACDRSRPVELRKLPAMHADTILDNLPLSCTPCKRARRKMSIHPAGRDVYVSVIFPGEKG